jgi:hypothetical protein
MPTESTRIMKVLFLNDGRLESSKQVKKEEIRGFETYDFFDQKAGSI